MKARMSLLVGLVFCVSLVGVGDSLNIEQLLKKAHQGNAQAQFELGVFYYSGLGVSKDDAEALKWYRLAAEQGHSGAQYEIGLRYHAGAGVSEDAKEAVKWYRLAAEQGDSCSQYNLGTGVFTWIRLAHIW